MLKPISGYRLRRLMAAGFAGLAALSVLTAGCAALYSSRPRYGRPARARVPVTVPGRDARQGRLAWPVVGTVTQGFGVKVHPLYGTKTNSLGIDVACAQGAPVKAVEPGRVSFADRFMGYGKTVIVDHGERLHSIYSRLTDIKVAVGNQVARGDIVGFAADTLHFEVRKEGRAVDPQEWLAPR